MKLLVIGNGGREHAIAWKLAQSTRSSTIFITQGNPGTCNEDKVTSIDIAPTAIEELLQFAIDESIAFTVVGPEAPLAAGIVDQFTAKGLPCFGPTQAAAQLESSKSFCKDFMEKHKVPTAKAKTFTDPTAAKNYIAQENLPIVIKADGLAAGKGVVIAHTESEAMNAIDKLLSLSDSPKIVIEEFLNGEEASFIVLCDGKNILPLASSQDHKARDNGDKGPNTGGMGAFSPAAVITDSLTDQIIKTIIQPIVDGMAAQGTPYTGFLYAGLMIDSAGNAQVLEFNCRLGDPETQPILMRLQSDLLTVFEACFEQRLNEINLSWDPRIALGVVLAAEGYPMAYKRGAEIHGLNESFPNDVKVFHAGTKLLDNKIVTNGGRVLCVTALGDDIPSAQKKAYAACAHIKWPGKFCRTDIGSRHQANSCDVQTA